MPPSPRQAGRVIKIKGVFTDMKRCMTILLSALMICALAVPSFAHFQMVYTPESALEKGGQIDMKLVFTHPFEAGHTMMMGKPEQFFVVHKGKKTDLLGDIKPIMWTSLTNSGKAYDMQYRLKGMGDFVFALAPAVYFEANEDAYMQQFTKMIVNVAGVPTDWDTNVGLPAEILPLVKPYGMWTGNVFSGIVMGDGKPVPYAEIEVEYMNHKTNMAENKFEKEAVVEAPQDSFVTQAIHADANGCFTYACPKTGWWGFAALGVGPKTEYKGKELSQDAVLWIQTKDMK